MRYLKFLIFIFVLIEVSFSQTRQDNFYPLDFEWNFENNPDNKEYHDLNIQAVKLMDESRIQFNDQKKDSLLNQAKDILARVIQERKNFYKAHMNLATVYITQKKYDKAEMILLSLQKIIEYPSCIFYLGILQEKNNNLEQAKKYYKRALFLYNEYLKTYLSGGLAYQDKELLQLLIDGKEKSLKRVKEQIKKNPDNSPLLDEEYIRNFDRKKFIDNF